MSTPESPRTPDDTPGMDQQNSSPSTDVPAETPSGSSSGSSGFSGFSGVPTPGEPLYGESADEEALRTLMRGAVQDLQGSPDALDHLRRAIPVRRQRRRQAMVGAAATLVLAAMAIPALVHAASDGGGSAAAPAGVASSPTPRPGEDGHTRPPGGPSGQITAGPGGAPREQHPTVGPGGPASATPTPSGTGSPAPDCSSDQLGQGASNADAPDAAGRVYGWFRVANVSDAPCTVPSGGLVQAVAQGSADASRIQVVGHTAGDPAADLPAGADGPVVLAPGQEYEVAFAWVPAGDGPGGCPVPTTPPASPTPTATDTSGVGGADAGTGSSGSEAASGADAPQSGSDPTTPPPGSVALNHTPAAGAPVVDGPVIQDACAGTVYTTSAIPQSDGTPTP
ncbi:hypothetical protein V2S66_22120 [Streptomyces sp. V4-01]|uniref:DUF4232 domain-containing protein n=1 Tax=Actinacidiphila polyblastidii TaxID=3110430 RepID=A0ABU7PFW2_9ACTN|nr:hypothetical protein [Streptomyces sp. V4-01]